MSDLVSIVVPCFNYGRYLPDCVRSLAAQSHANWECIIVDDGSTDNTSEICHSLAASESRIKVVRQRNLGVNAARNTGLRLATGEYIQLLDADDMLECDKLRVQVEYLRAHSEIDVVLGEAAFFDSRSTGELRRWRRVGATGATARVSGSGHLILRALVAGNIAVIHAALVRRNVFDLIGFLDEEMELNEDWEFWFRCGFGGCKFAFVSEGQDRALVREHDGSPSRIREPMLRATVALRERIDGDLPGQLRSENAQRISEARAKLGIELVRQGRKGEGWEIYRKALLTASRKTKLLLQLLRLLPGATRAAALGRRGLSGLFPAK